MTFPTIAAKGTTYSTGGTATTSHAVDLPNGLVAGDRVLIFAGLRDNTAFTWPSSPAWTAVAAVAAPTSGGRLEVRYHDVDGTEGWTDGSTITVTTAGSVKGVAFAWKITGHSPATAPAAATATASGSANPDPASLDPADWATEDTLWGAVSYSNANNTTSAYPTDYGDDQENAVATGASAASARICSRKVNASSQDPSAFTISAAQNCATVTFAIRPAAVQELAGNMPAAADLDGALGLSLPLAGAPAAAASLSGALAVTRGLAGAVPVAAGLTGQLGSLAALAGVIPAAFDLDGALAANLGRRPRLLIVGDQP